MVDGGVKPKKTFGRKIKSHDEDISTLYGLVGGSGNGGGGIVSGSPRGHVTGGGSSGIDATKFVRRSGDLVEGVLGYASQALAISGGNLKLNESSGGNTLKIRKNIFVSPESGTADDLDTMEGLLQPGQEHRLIGITGNTITIKHNNTGAASGNEIPFICPGAVDYVLDDDAAVDVFYDDTVDKWQIVGDAISGGGGGGGASLTVTTGRPLTPELGTVGTWLAEPTELYKCVDGYTSTKTTTGSINTDTTTEIVFSIPTAINNVSLDTQRLITKITIELRAKNNSATEDNFALILSSDLGSDVSDFPDNDSAWHDVTLIQTGSNNLSAGGYQFKLKVENALGDPGTFEVEVKNVYFEYELETERVMEWPARPHVELLDWTDWDPSAVDINLGDYMKGHAFSMTLEDDTAFTFTNPPEHHEAHSFLIELIQDGTGGHTADFTTNNTINGTVPTIDTGAGNKTLLVGVTVDGGSTYYLFRTGNSAASGGGGGEDQSPWLSDIDADGFDLTDISNIEFRISTGTPGATVPSIYLDASGDMVQNVDAGDQYFRTINGEVVEQLQDAEWELRTENENGPVIKLNNNDQTPMDNDVVGTINFTGNDNLLANVTYAAIVTNMDNVVSTSKQADFEIRVMHDNAIAPIIDYTGSNATFRFSSNVDVVRPNRNNGIDLGAASQSWADYYGAGFFEVKEISSPSTPPSNSIRLYAKDSGGVSNLFVKLDDGTEIGPIGAAGSPSNLNSLSDVTIASVTNNEILSYDSGSSQWINQTPAEAGLLGLLGGTMTGAIDMNGNDLTDVDDIFFDATDTEISQAAGILSIRVGSSDTIRLRRGTTSEVILNNSGLEIGSGVNLGFYGTTPVSQQSVASDTLTNLYTALRNYGLIA